MKEVDVDGYFIVYSIVFISCFDSFESYINVEYFMICFQYTSYTSYLATCQQNCTKNPD